MSTKQTFTYPINLSSSQDYSAALSFLNEKIDNLKKKVSYFDAYNISAAVTDAQQLNSQLNALPINQSLVINTSPFFLNGKTYSPGDILLKLSNGDVVHIKSQTGGVYYPFKIERSGNEYVLQYTYSGAAPATGSTFKAEYSETDKATDEAELAEKITFTGIKETTKNDIYGIWKEVVNENKSTGDKYFTFKAYDSAPDDSTNPRYVKPFLQFYLCKTVNNEMMQDEQLYIDYKLEIISQTQNEKITYYWKVTIDSIPTNLWVKVK